MSWAECQQQVLKVFGAKYKAYDSKDAATKAFTDGWEKHWGQGSTNPSTKATAKTSSISPSIGEIDYDAISVDVGTSGNPGPVEYKGVDTRNSEIIFSVGPISKGTNNLGEFLAIVHALAYLKKIGSSRNIYSDSVNAINWVKKKNVSSTLVRDASTQEIWDLVDRAIAWLQNNQYDTKVMKWNTKEWGQIKADYGRK